MAGNEQQAYEVLTTLFDVIRHPDAYEQKVKDILEAEKKLTAIRDETLTKERAAAEALAAVTKTRDEAATLRNETLQILEPKIKLTDGLSQQLQAQQADLDAREGNIKYQEDTQKKRHADAHKDLDTRIANTVKVEKALGTRAQELDAREKRLAQKEDDYDRRVTKLKELTGA